jgi:hypothetical protein
VRETRILAACHAVPAASIPPCSIVWTTALQQLEVSGWLSRPDRDREWHSDPLPGYLILPSWARSW